MMKTRILALACALALWAAPLAVAEEKRSFSQDMKDFGAYLGESISAFGEQFKLFSQDPKDYIESNGIRESIEQKAKDVGQSLQEYWPTFKASIEGSVEAIMDSDMSWDDKKQALQEYGELAVPFLADVDFEAMGEEGYQAIQAIKGLMGFETDEETKQWVERNKQKLAELREYLAS